MNVSNNAIMRSLPLVASSLGNKYDVKVVVGGRNAYTDGSTIHLPALPLDCDDKLLGLVRGYIDHESAHVRETDFEVLKSASMTPLVKHIWNILEDWRVENKLSSRFPGCRGNFRWLIAHHFASKPVELNPDPAMQIVDYILYSVRSWDCALVEKNRRGVMESLATAFPRLLVKLDALLQRVKKHCFSTRDAFKFSELLVKLIEDELKQQRKEEQQNQQLEQQQNSDGQELKPDGDNSNTDSSESDESISQDGDKTPGESTQQKMKSLKKLIDAAEADLPGDFAEGVGKELEQAGRGSANSELKVAVESSKEIHALSADELSTVRRASAALHSRLHALLQSTKLSRSLPARSGKLDPRRLHRITCNNPKLFLRHEEKQGLNTCFHILLDSSGSMRQRMDLATQACYAVAQSLDKLDGVSLGVTAFPARSVDSSPGVVPILRHDQKLHANFNVKATGSTPMGEALLWTLQETFTQAQNRKIILIISDGQADSHELAETAIKHGMGLGIEFYGLGIHDRYIQRLLPETSEVIFKLEELVPCMFKLLQRTLVGGR